MPSLPTSSMPPSLASHLENFSEEYRQPVMLAWAKVAAKLGDKPHHWSAEYCLLIVSGFTRSAYVMESCTRFPEWLNEWSSSESDLYCDRSEDAYRLSLSEVLAQVDSDEALMRCLREFRRREMTRIIWRDTCDLSNLQNTISEVSALADVCIGLTQNFIYDQLTDRYGTPRSSDKQGARRQEMLVLGMGKLGAKELNVSSDIDLIFAYPESGETDHPTKPVDNQRFFTKLGQRLISTLDQVTGDGFVFRVDMRLRPYGSAGALALNFSSYEDYYESQGREWERFAMVKARVITGTQEDKATLQGIILPFVYRRYTDFSSIQALRDMKRLIMSEVHRKGGEQNIKLGTGGIREIEFIVQACQLIHGGRDLDLQQPGLLPVMALLLEKQHLPEDWVSQLLAANEFLRNTEHAIQGLEDKQTQLIPVSESDRQRVAWSLGYECWEDAQQELAAHRERVNALFSAFLEEAPENNSEQVLHSSKWLHLWQHHVGEEEWQAALTEAGYAKPKLCWQALEDLRKNRLFKVMSSDAAKRLEQFLPMLLVAAAEQSKPSLVFVRVMGLVKAVLGRTIYLVLLYENPKALRLLCSLCENSPWVAEHLAKSPVILDELLDAHSLYTPPAKAELEDELRQCLLRIPEEDLETQMDALRHFKQSHMLRVAAAELTNKLPLMKVSDYLTWLAEVLVAKSVVIAWQNMVDKYGLPGCIDEASGNIGFSVIGYGKLGGIELSYHSDLDMVFLYECDEQGMTRGNRSINNQVFYTRLGQRVIHLLSTQTTQGDLYEVDMRLRPSGNSGMLVSSLSAFEKYQFKDAWTWEHQALVRGRFIAGDQQVADKFELIRSAVLGQSRDNVELLEEVREMRLKMKEAARSTFSSEEQAGNDIKLGDGGIVDIEFITQFGVLQNAKAQPELLEWTDNVRLLEALNSLQCFGQFNLLPLIDAYRNLRSALHRKNLADSDYQVSLEDFPAEREVVRSAWCQIFGVCSSDSLAAT